MRYTPRWQSYWRNKRPHLSHAGRDDIPPELSPSWAHKFQFRMVSYSSKLPAIAANQGILSPWNNQATDTFNALASARTSISDTGRWPFSSFDKPDWSMLICCNCKRATRSVCVIGGFADFRAWRTRPPTIFFSSTSRMDNPTSLVPFVIRVK